MKPHKPDASKFGWVGSSCPGKAQMRKNVQKQFLPLDRETRPVYEALMHQMFEPLNQHH